MPDTEPATCIQTQVGLPDCAGGGEVLVAEWSSGVFSADWRPERRQSVRWTPIGGRFPGRVIRNEGWVEIILPEPLDGELRTRSYAPDVVEADWRLTADHAWTPVENLTDGAVCVAP